MLTVWLISFYENIRTKRTELKVIQVNYLIVRAVAVILSQGKLTHCVASFDYFKLLSFIFYLGPIVGQQLNRLNQKLSSWKLHIVLTSWLLGLTVLIYAYSTTLTSRLTTPEYNYLVKSVKDVADNENILPMTIKGAPIHEELAGSTSPLLQEIERRIQKYPELMSQSPLGCFEKMLDKPNRVVIMVNPFQIF